VSASTSVQVNAGAPATVTVYFSMPYTPPSSSNGNIGQNGPPAEISFGLEDAYGNPVYSSSDTATLSMSGDFPGSWSNVPVGVSEQLDIVTDVEGVANGEEALAAVPGVGTAYCIAYPYEDAGASCSGQS
jgi:hypothetical protein